MKKRLAAICALAHVGILSGCGQTSAQEQLADTVTLTPMPYSELKNEEIYALDGNDSCNENNFAAYHYELNKDTLEMTFRRYIWDGEQKSWGEGSQLFVSGLMIEKDKGDISMIANDAANEYFGINVFLGGAQSNGSSSSQLAAPLEQDMTGKARHLAMQTQAQTVAYGEEIPLLVRTFTEQESNKPLNITAFTAPENDAALKEAAYAEAYTVTFNHAE